jgi:regulatory protein
MKKSKTARSVAAGLLAARQYSAAGITKKLTERGFDEEDIDAVVAEFLELGYIDDLKFAQSIIRHYKDKELGRIKHELFKRGIDRETIKEALEISDVVDDDNRPAESRADCHPPLHDDN